MSNTKGKKRRKILKNDCMNCTHCNYLCEGDHLCEKHDVFVTCDWEFTDDFYYCGGKDYSER